MELCIKENFESRKWLSLSILEAGVSILKKWGILCFIIVALTCYLIDTYDLQKHFYLILMVPCIPPVISCGLFIAAPIMLFPQHWYFYGDRIKCQGVRGYGTVTFSNITNWEFESIAEMDNYHQLKINWKRWSGLQQGRFEIIVPPAISFKNIKHLLDGKG